MTDTLDPALEAALDQKARDKGIDAIDSLIWEKASKGLSAGSDEMFDAGIAAYLAAAAPQAEIDRLREDAERWRALMSSERLHFMGCAGFNIEGPHSVEDEGAPLATAHATPKPGAQLHFGMEFWSEFKWRSSEEAERYTDRFERDFMVVYVDEMRRRALHPQTPNGGQRD